MHICHDNLDYELALVPSGEFLMGSSEGEGRDDEHPQHKIFLDAYYIGVTAVNNAQFRRFKSSHNSGDWNSKTLNDDNQPVVKVSWYDAKDFCNWSGMQLPTEAQWEKTARGTDSRKYPWGNDWPPPLRAANIPKYQDVYSVSSPVGIFGISEPYGTHDMAGNVWEWCADWYGNNFYATSPKFNPMGLTRGTYRVLRGGSWGYGGPIVNRSAARYWYSPSICYYYYGFRCSVTVPNQKRIEGA